MTHTFTTPIPTQWIGPLKINCHQSPQASHEFEEVFVPLATYESPLWPSTQRGARITHKAGGIITTVLGHSMTRSIYLKGLDARSLSLHRKVLLNPQTLETLQQITHSTSRFAQLMKIHDEIVGDLWFIRFQFETGDASGHNMATKAAQALLEYLLTQFSDLQYGSISGNLCTDKKNSAINGILGRGHHVIAEVNLQASLCQKYLKATPEALAQLNLEKNWVGSVLSGGVRTANAHFANALLAIYLATGQDAANIVEGSQGFTLTRVLQDGSLYFSVSLPHLIIGTVGNGKHHPEIQQALEKMGCAGSKSPGENTARLASIIAAAVLCSELSLLAAQTNPGELVRSHLALERASSHKEPSHVTP